MMWILGLGGIGAALVVCCGGAGAYFFLARPTADAPPIAVDSQPGGTGLGPQVAPDPLVAPANGTGSAVMVTMTVTSTTGLTTIPTGTTCSFAITHREDSGGLNCQAHVNCNGVALYGDSDTNGFFPCPVFSTSPPAVSGSDTGTTAADQDPSFVIDSTSGTVSISDDASGHAGAFTVVGSITVH